MGWSRRLRCGWRLPGIRVQQRLRASRRGNVLQQRELPGTVAGQWPLSLLVFKWYRQCMQTALAKEYRLLSRDSTAHQPLAYLRLRRAIRNVVERQDIQSGQALPSERDLARALTVSRVTVRKALEGLMEAGLLVRRRGAGTFIAERIVKPIARLSSFTEDLRERGLHPRSEFLERTRGAATPEEAMALNLSPGASVVRLYRVRYSGDEPLAVERSVVPASVLPDPSLVVDSLYVALEQGHCRPQRALQRLRAVALNVEQAQLLHVAPGSAGLAIERRGFLQDGRVVEFTRSWYRGDRYDFVAELHTDGSS